MTRLALIALSLALTLARPAAAQEAEPQPMTAARVVEIVRVLDPGAALTPNGAEFHIEDIPVLIIMDPGADRMRAMVPIRSAETLTEEELMRMMQADFDTALDARYAVANGRVWAVYIHPLSPLTPEQLISGIGQTVNAAQTYGGLYTSGLMQFGSGDSEALQRDLIDRLLERGQDI